MVRESSSIKFEREKLEEGRRKILLLSSVFLLLSSFFFLPSTVLAVETLTTSEASNLKKETSKVESAEKKTESATDKDAEETLEGDEEKKTLVLKVMIVNPSKKHKQIYPMKAYLPEEIQPQHILAKEDLEVAYDADKKSYFVTRQVELDPGQSVVKTIKVEDIWLIPDDQLHQVSEEASQLFKKVEGTPYEEKARLLLSNMEVLLTQIYELQNDQSLTPDQHISAYRDNKNKLREIELDMIALRRIVFQATGETSAFSMGSNQAGAGFMGASFNPEVVDKQNKGSLPEWVAWRAIFIILIFLCIGASSFYLIWHRQLKLLEKRKKQEALDKKPQTVFEDVLGKNPAEGANQKLDNKIIFPAAASASSSSPKKSKGKVA